MKGHTCIIRLMFIEQLARHPSPCASGTEITGSKGRAGGEAVEIRSERQGDGNGFLCQVGQATVPRLSVKQ